jgi:hypothetical protein
MNKPEYYRLIGYTDVKKYIDFIHDNRLEFKEVLTYNRADFFMKSKTFFLIERFLNHNPKIYDEFLTLSDNLFDLLKSQYGDGLIYNLQFSLLPDGSEIFPHYDVGLGFTFSHRVHVPIITNNNIIFSIGNKNFNFKSGEIVEINNKNEHSVQNLNTKTFYRIHLILDYLPLIYEKFIKT